MSLNLFRPLVIALLIALAIGCALVGGPGNGTDVELIRAGIALRNESPLATSAGRILDIVGGSAVTLGVAMTGALRLWFSGRVRRAVWFGGVIVGGRLLVEAMKLLVHRARPALDPHPVTIHSLSFPSAHAANSMIAFGAMALMFARPARRGPALIAAVCGSLIVGASRTLLGVHYPSDVVAGWAVGAAWLLAWWPLARWLAADQAQHPIVGRHRRAIDQR